MMPAEAYSYVSSRLVKEIVKLGGSVQGLIPELVEKRLRSKVQPRPAVASAESKPPRRK
jgi:pantetheine-phosphate adenylyltransferase